MNFNLYAIVHYELEKFCAVVHELLSSTDVIIDHRARKLDVFLP